MVKKTDKINNTFKIEINNIIFTISLLELENIQFKGIDFKYIID